MTALPEERARAVARPTVVRLPAPRAQRPSRPARTHVRRLILLADAAGSALAAMAGAGVASWDHPGIGAGGGVASFGIVCAALVGMLAVRGGRRSQIAPRVADDLGFIATSLGAAGLCLMALRSVPAIGAVLSPASIGVAFGTAVLSVPVAREAGILLAARNRANVARVVVVGSGFIAAYLTNRLSRSPLVEVHGIVDDRPSGNQPTLGRLDDLPFLCQVLSVDRVVVAFSERHPARSAELVRAVRDLVEVDVVVRFFEVTGWASRLTDITGLPLVNLGAPPGSVQRGAKRAMDIAVAGIGLALVSPLLLGVALWVRVESGAPVLFRQERVGQDRRPFQILKFRTMRPADAEPGRAAPTTRTPFDAIADPGRITRAGSFLRRTGLDELPQLVNVLRGDMSLVGPRPFIPEECGALGGTMTRRFDVRPGMTGMWQVCGQHELTLEELVRLDVQYATTWTLWSDLRILARTPGRLLRGSAPAS